MTEHSAADSSGPWRRGRAAALVVCCALLAGQPAVADGTPTVAEPLVPVPVAQMWQHLEALQQIADEHGGDRAMDSTGYAASVQYVEDRLTAAGYEVSLDEMTYLEPVVEEPPVLEQLSPEPAVYEPGTDFHLTRLPTVGSGVAEMAVANPDGGGVVCAAEDVEGLEDGQILLLRIDGCGIEEIWAALSEAGLEPAGLLVAPPENESGLPEPAEFGIPVLLGLPILMISGDVADSLVTESGVEIMMSTGAVPEVQTAANVIAETDRAEGDEVILLGGHLDSFVFSPGINDNASGVAALLTLAEQIADSDLVLDRDIRFGFWAAEEIGLEGSESYVESLGPAEIGEIGAYLNFDMIGSPNWGRFVYDPAVAMDPATTPPGSAEIHELFVAWFDSQGLPTESVWTDGRSDDGPFGVAGVPIGGLFSGAEDIKSPEQAELFGGEAGEWFDPCYHLPCDTIDNVDRQILGEFGTALAAVALHMAGARVAESHPAPVAVPARPTFTG